MGMHKRGERIKVGKFLGTFLPSEVEGDPEERRPVNCSARSDFFFFHHSAAVVVAVGVGVASLCLRQVSLTSETPISVSIVMNLESNQFLPQFLTISEQLISPRWKPMIRRQQSKRTSVNAFQTVQFGGHQSLTTTRTTYDDYDITGHSAVTSQAHDRPIVSNVSLLHLLDRKSSVPARSNRIRCCSFFFIIISFLFLF